MAGQNKSIPAFLTMFSKGFRIPQSLFRPKIAMGLLFSQKEVFAASSWPEYPKIFDSFPIYDRLSESGSYGPLIQAVEFGTGLIIIGIKVVGVKLEPA